MSSDFVNTQYAATFNKSFQIPAFWENTQQDQSWQLGFHVIPPIGPQKLQASLLAVTDKYQLFQTQTQTSNSLLIKRLKPHWKNNQDLRQQALREAQILKSLAQNPPSSTKYQEALSLLPQFAAKGFDTDLPFLAYTFIEGYSLRDIYRIQVAKTKTLKTLGIKQNSEIPSTEKLLNSLAQQLACLHLHPHPIVHGYLSNEHVIYDGNKCHLIGLGYALFEHQK
jgi:serine/threonine protein kinase